MNITHDLPRLAVIVEFGVEQTSGGQLLLHRLFALYPAGRLLVIYDPGQATSDPATFLPGVTYRPYGFRIPRLIRNRFNPMWPLLMARWMRRHTGRVIELLADFAPDAVLTVPHWYLWFTAADVARRLGLPLHLVVHDDWPGYTTFRRAGRIWDAVRWGCRQVMRPVYRGAASRLCISPGMAELYRAWFGVNGTVMYPSRGDDSPSAQVRVRPLAGGPPVVAFCGNIHLAGTASLLRQMAGVLAELGGYLDLYTLTPTDRLNALGLALPNVRECGFYPASAMGEQIGRTAHALFLPASFDPRERIDIATLFPSKLADYTAIGLPVLAWGPEYSSAIRWTSENVGATVPVTTLDPGPVRDIVARLVSDPKYAAAIAAAGMSAGSQCFDPNAARGILYASLRHPDRAGGYSR